MAFIGYSTCAIKCTEKDLSMHASKRRELNQGNKI